MGVAIRTTGPAANKGAAPNAIRSRNVWMRISIYSQRSALRIQVFFLNVASVLAVQDAIFIRGAKLFDGAG